MIAFTIVTKYEIPLPMSTLIVSEEGWFGQPKYSTPNLKSFYAVSVSAFKFQFFKKVRFKRCPNNIFMTSVYRRKTFSGLYTKWDSFTPPNTKLISSARSPIDSSEFAPPPHWCNPLLKILESFCCKMVTLKVLSRTTRMFCGTDTKTSLTTLFRPSLKRIL